MNHWNILPTLRPLWLVVGSVLGTLLIVSVCSLYFHGAVMPDYLITGLIASLIVASIAINLLNRANRHALALMNENAARFTQMFERHNAPMLLIDPASGSIVDANSAAGSFYGYPVEQMKSMNVSGINTLTQEQIEAELACALREERNYFVFPHRLCSGEVRTVEVHSSPLDVAGQPLLLSIIHDITERRLAEEQIHQLAFYDPLTGLPNRRLLMDRLKQAFSVSMRSGKHGALLFLDLDNFKTLNDTKGHDIGDMLLVDVAERLKSCVRDGDTIARLGGDEFMVVLESLNHLSTEAATQAELVAEKIHAALSQPYKLGEHACHNTPSIGIVLFRGHQDSLDNLLKHADTAMYQAKTAGRNAIRFYDPEMQAAIEARADLEDELHQALAKQQLRLHYQIQVDSLARPLGSEALLRWEHPVRGLISPMQFIPLAEDTGLILPIGLWVLQTSCAQLAAWQSDPLARDLPIAVNVSAKQFRQTDFVAQVQRTLLESGAKPSLLKLELTESTVLENVEDTIAKMREIKLLGVSFSMDDFGTGYSSLQYLKRLPLDQIKIDRSFVRDIATDPNDAAIVQTIIAMTQALALKVIAEGVETEAQRDFLDRHGCHAFQGFLFSKPVPADQFEQYLQDNSVTP